MPINLLCEPFFWQRMIVQYKQNFLNKSIYISKLEASIRTISIRIADSWSVCPGFPLSTQGRVPKFSGLLRKKGSQTPRSLSACSAHTRWTKSQLTVFLHHLAAYLPTCSFRQPALGQRHGHLHCFSKAPRFPGSLGSNSFSHSAWQKDLSFLFVL